MKGYVAALDRTRGPLWRRLAVPALLALAASAALAEDVPTLDEGAHFDVRSAYLEPAEHVYQLNATLDLALSKNAEQAIREGVPVLLELDLSVVRKRRYLPDVEVASLAQRWQIHYHALSERYLVNNLNSGQICPPRHPARLPAGRFRAGGQLERLQQADERLFPDRQAGNTEHQLRHLGLAAGRCGG